MRTSLNDLKTINRLAVTNARLLNFGMSILTDKDKEFLSTVKPSEVMSLRPQGMKLWEIGAVAQADDLTTKEEAKLILEMNEWGLCDKEDVRKAYKVLLEENGAK